MRSAWLKLEEVAVEEPMKADVIFTSPETSERHLDVLHRLSDRFMGVVVDESHCVVNW